jgi:nucleotide-binding universal stress UspA family protein
MEARLRQAPLLLVHVDLVPTESLGANPREISGELLLALNAKAAVELEPDIDVRTELVAGSSVRAELVQFTQRCTVLALGIDVTRSRATHGARGPIEDYVAVHADCPVVMVAPASFVAPGARTQVTVGWSEGYNARLAMAAAAEEAHLRGAVLTVVSVPPASDPRLAGIVPTPDHESALIDVVGEIEHRYPGLRIDIAHRTGDVATALSAMSTLSELFVLGSHHSSKPWSIRTGPVAEALMRDGHCPVMLVGRRARQRGGRATPEPVAGSETPSPSQVRR